MNTYKLLIAYDGTNYSGWQTQTNATAIQTLIENALQILLKSKTPITGAGRTDAGVHAYGQAAHFNSENLLDTARIKASLNGLLPPDIRILDLTLVDNSFHARYNALSKEYHYHLHLHPVQDPHKRLYSHHVPHPVDESLLKQGALLFVGTHDFTSFANEAHQGCAAKNAIRTIFRLDIVPEEGGLRLEFEGSGFLYKMVRNITGTLLDISCRKLSLEEIPLIFAAKNRCKAGRIAPACGLFLKKIQYLQKT